ncbi:hypothetical protein V7793_16250 [Streptomyces sp. KLMMK]|uniref:hypothetical protein n=1 Tax=Streptomyces sp. KLMMK TaxID=3109353 RepID=UPI00300AF525
MASNEERHVAFGQDEFERLARAAKAVGKTPEAFVRDLALRAADGPVAKALENAEETIGRLAADFARVDRSTRRPVSGSEKPMSSRDLRARPRHAA